MPLWSINDDMQKKRWTRSYVLAWTLCFAVVFLAGYSSFWFAGKSFIWKNDGISIHYMTLLYMGRYVREFFTNIITGNIVLPLWDFSMRLGENVWGGLSYGFDPLNLVSAFIPSVYVEYLYDILVVLRLYLAGLSFSALCFYMKRDGGATLVGSLAYVFSGYGLFTAVRHPFFMLPMIYLPLMVLGLEKILQGKETRLFLFSVCLSALNGFYFLYMETIALLFYGVVRSCFLYGRSGNYWHDSLKVFLKASMAYLLGVGLASPLLLPSVFSFIDSETRNFITTKNLFYFSSSKYAAMLFSALGSRWPSWDYLGMSALLFSALICLFSNKRKHWDLKVLFAASLMFYFVPWGSKIMNGFGYVSFRWTFIFALLLAFVITTSLRPLFNMDRTQKAYMIVVSFVYGVLLLASDRFRVETSILWGCMFLFAFVAVFLFFQEKDHEEVVSWPYGIVLLLVMLNLVCNAHFGFSPQGGNYTAQFRVRGKAYQHFAAMPHPLSSEGWGRIDRSDAYSTGKSNAAMFYRYPGLSGYYSLQNGRVAQFIYRTMECASSGFCSNSSFGVDMRANLEALCSVKCFMRPMKDKNLIPYGFRLADSRNNSDYYANDYALPLGYSYDNWIENDGFQKLDGLQKAHVMMEAVMLNEASDPLLKTPVQIVDYKISRKLLLHNMQWEKRKLKVSKKGAVMELQFEGKPHCEYYIRLKNFFSDSSIHVIAVLDRTVKKLDSESNRSQFSTMQKDYLIHLGYHNERQYSAKLQFFMRGSFSLEDVEVLCYPMKDFPARIEKLRAEPLKDIKVETNRVTGTVDFSKDKILCFSIPYSVGWSARVDGKPARLLEANVLFMALPLKQGHHEIELHYMTPGLLTGCGLGALSLVIILFSKFKNRIKYKKRS